MLDYAKLIGGDDRNCQIWDHKQIFQPNSNIRGVDGLTVLLSAWQMEPYMDWNLFTSLKAMIKLQS